MDIEIPLSVSHCWSLKICSTLFSCHIILSFKTAGVLDSWEVMPWSFGTILYKVTSTGLPFCYHVGETSNVDTMCETTFDIMAIKLLGKKSYEDGFCV